MHKGYGKEPLTAADLDLAVAMAQKLSDAAVRAGAAELGGEVLVPDVDSVLCPAAELVFDDAPWLTETDTETAVAGDQHRFIHPTISNAVAAKVGVARDQYRFVHPKISNAVAAKVGVNSLRQRLLATSSQGLSMGIESEAFGQTESLTQRLAHILALYVSSAVACRLQLVL